MSEYEDEEFMFGDRKCIKTKYTTLDEDRFKIAEAFSQFQLKEEDVLIVTFPKSGTTWMRRIISLINADADVKKAEEERVDKYIPTVEIDGLPATDAGQGPRFMSIHFNYYYLPESVKKGKVKIIYVARNPKDVVVSNYFFFKAFKQSRIELPFEEYFELFINGYAPFRYWDEHIKNYYENRNELNLLYVTYEDLHQSLEQKVGEVAAFLGKELSEDQIKTIAAHSRFDKVKDNPAANYDWWENMGVIDQKVSPFMRKGVVGDWKNYLTPEMSKRLEDVVEAKLQPLGLNFVYELNQNV